MSYFVIARHGPRTRWLGRYPASQARLVAALHGADIVPPPLPLQPCRPWRQRNSRPATVELDHEAALVEDGLRVWEGIAALRAARAGARQSVTPPLFRRLGTKRVSRLEEALRDWCQRVEVEVGEDLGMKYHHYVEWGSGWKRWPVAEHDILQVTVGEDGQHDLQYDRRGRLRIVVLGDPERPHVVVRKLRGHKLAIERLPAPTGQPGDGSRLAELSLMPPLSA